MKFFKVPFYSFFIGAARGFNTPRLASKLKIRFQPMPRGLALMRFTVFCISVQFASCQSTKEVTVGAYYFDGWTGKTTHASPRLKQDFPERKPIWGWVTSTPELMDTQMQLASEAGIDFFNFCWYYNPSKARKHIADDPKNQALELFMDAPNHYGMQFSIMVANHRGYIIKKEDWSELVEHWVSIMKNKSYQEMKGKPIISFFSLKSLYQSFKTDEHLKDAIIYLKDRATESGLGGVAIGVCDVRDKTMISKAESVGVDFITSYNNHTYALSSKNERVQDISVMASREKALWNYIKSLSSDLKQIPAVTLNWDSRPIKLDKDQIFENYGKQSIISSVLSARKWVKDNSKDYIQDRILMLYAWNEYAEGAWLTQSKELGTSLLDGLKEGLFTKLQ